MSTSIYDPDKPQVSMLEFRRGWEEFLSLGIALITLGIICIIFNATPTFSSVRAFGWLLLVAGGIQLLNSLGAGTWSGFLLYLLNALLRGITGYMLVRYASLGTGSLILVLGSFFLVGGLFRAIGSLEAKIPRWGWAFFSGLVSVILGMTVLWQMPNASLRIIGSAVSIDLILDGIAVCSVASAIRQVSQRTVSQGA